MSHEESTDYYLERDPGGTLEKLWLCTKNENENNHEKSEFLAARRSYNELFIVVTKTCFGYTNQETNIFVSGILSSSNNNDDHHHRHHKEQQ